jgi:hypothetical protein
MHHFGPNVQPIPGYWSIRSSNRLAHAALAPPIGTELRPDSQGYLSVTPKGIMEDFAQDLSAKEKKLLVATAAQTTITYELKYSRRAVGCAIES